MILMLSNREKIAEMVQSDLAKEGFQVEMVTEYPDAALRLEQDVQFEIILLDFEYDKQDIFEICQNLKLQNKHRFLPIVGILSKDQFLDQLMAFEYGADDFILTPYTSWEIQLKVRSIKRIIEMSKQLRQKELMVQNLQNIQRIMVTLNHYINNALTPLSFAVQFMEQMPNDSNSKRLQTIASDTVVFVSKVLQSLQTLVDSGKVKVTQDGIYKNIMFDIEQELNQLISRSKQH
ncbi:MAG: hypothetical protein KDE52_13615 [Calditrichaeota bacterium]|nr:hypothetical protein [Calditrichota bacterium]MCB9067167.1 hypothetical protein [Calditrichia bacterium]